MLNNTRQRVRWSALLLSWIAFALLCGCDPSMTRVPDSGDDPMTAYRKTLQAQVPESLKPLTAEMEKLKMAAIRPRDAGPYIALPGELPYQMAEGGRMIKIDLSYAEVTDDFLEKLKALPDIESMTLTGTKITDTGLERLAGMKALKSLGIRGTQVSEEAADKFRESHPQCKVNGPK